MMKFIVTASLILCLNPLANAASINPTVQKALIEENVANGIRYAIENDQDVATAIPLYRLSNTITLQTLDELSLTSSSHLRLRVKNMASTLLAISAKLSDRIQLYWIYRQAGGASSILFEQKLAQQIGEKIESKTLENSLRYILLSHPLFYETRAWDPLFSQLLAGLDYKLEFLSKPSVGETAPAAALVDLIHSTPPVERYKNGIYKATPKLYMFCRVDRAYACLMLMRDKTGALVKTKDNKTPWSQPSLGHSKFNLPFNQPNGNTPSGVYTIDGVMPTADQKQVFGKFRRMILNFIDKSAGEDLLKIMLPSSNHDLLWWHESVVAREMGRGLFRIHGTGYSSERDEPYFPFVPTSGCVAQRENSYNRVEYRDQRLLLDALMTAAGQNPSYQNEEKIRGLLYVVNINNEARGVELADLKKLGLF